MVTPTKLLAPLSKSLQNIEPGNWVSAPAGPWIGKTELSLRLSNQGLGPALLDSNQTDHLMYLYHACQDTSLLPHHYTWICILGILSITKDIRCCPILYRLPFAWNQSCWWSGAARRSCQTYDFRSRRWSNAGDAALYRQLFTDLLKSQTRCGISSRIR